MKQFLALALVAIALAGCSDKASDGCGEQDGQGRYVVCMTGAFTFEPKNLEVPVGATVVWVFKGGGAHDAAADDGSWKSPLLSKDGQEWAHTFDAAGSYPYHCNPHVSQGMTGTIVVA